MPRRRPALVTLAALLALLTAAVPPAGAERPVPGSASSPASPANSRPSSTATPPARGHSPQPKTREEYDDFNAAVAAAGGAALEKAADAFAAKHPDSELRAYLYARAMHEYQTERNAGRLLAMGDKVLALDPGDLVALVLTATVLADTLPNGAPARDPRVAEIKRRAGLVLDTADTAAVLPPDSTPRQVEAYKDQARTMALSARAIAALKTGDDAAAEHDLKAAAALGKDRPDPFVWYHLALVQERQQRFGDALESLEQARRYATANRELQALIQGQRQRLLMLLQGLSPGKP